MFSLVGQLQWISTLPQKCLPQGCGIEACLVQSVLTSTIKETHRLKQSKGSAVQSAGLHYHVMQDSAIITTPHGLQRGVDPGCQTGCKGE